MSVEKLKDETEQEALFVLRKMISTYATFRELREAIKAWSCLMDALYGE